MGMSHLTVVIWDILLTFLNSHPCSPLIWWRRNTLSIYDLCSRSSTTPWTTDYYLYRLETPCKRNITAPQAATTSLGSRHDSVACLCYDIGKAACCYTITTPTFPTIQKGPKNCTPLILLQNNYIHLLGNTPCYFSLYFLWHISARTKV
jgi:hypothetical protein